jgi:hypothetical protein
MGQFMTFDRRVLEEAQTFDEMRLIAKQVLEDRTKYSDREIRCRVGVIKELIEEYLPLIQLVRVLPGFTAARLTPQSHEGPDAFLSMSDGSELGVQITIAGETHSTALQREMLARGEMVFPAQSASRKKHTGSIEATGRIVTTKAANTKELIRDVIGALKKKRDCYRSGSQILLISTFYPLITITSDWSELLSSEMEKVEFSPYDVIYVNVDDQCIEYRRRT